jgi:hypothetical protein
LDDEAKIDAASRTGDNVPERRRQMAADPRSTTRETREVPELEISFEQVLAVVSQDASGRRSTLELVRDIARVQGELTAELFERLQNHAVYAALNDHDRSLIDAALHDNLKGPLKRLMFYMLKASCNKKASASARQRPQEEVATLPINAEFGRGAKAGAPSCHFTLALS